MSKLFIELTTGTTRIDNSMGNSTKIFNKDYHTTFVRPHLISSIQGKQWGGLTLSEVIIEGYDYALFAAESPEQILEMIEAIELVTITTSVQAGNIEWTNKNELRDAALGAG